MDAAPTAEERAAVDEVLGMPESGWEGAERRSAGDLRVVRGGREAREQRHLLLPALHALQGAVGWISRGGLNYVCQRLSVPPAEAYGVATFYAMFSVEPQPADVVHVCDDLVCRGAGALEICAALQDRSGPEGADAGGWTWRRSPCLGACERAPVAFVQRSARDDVTVGPLSAENVETIVELDGSDDPGPTLPQRMPEGGAGLRLLRRVGRTDPASLETYRTDGGYGALRAAIDLGPEAVVRVVTDAKLLGRGGAAFPTGVKWKAVADQPVTPHFVICNADESEPGTFKDRVVMESDPFAVIEALTLAGFATGSERGFLYVRGEYPLAHERLWNAIEQSRAAGLLGGDVMGSGLAFDIELRRGAGAYICGEETALFNSTP
jgi:NADH-quinone oxidoreductase subunit F